MLTLLIDKFDQISFEPRLFVKRKDRYKTGIGALITSLVFISVFIISCFFLITFYEKKEVNVIYYKDMLNKKPNITINYFMWKYFEYDNEIKNVDPRLAEVVSVRWDVRNGSYKTTIMESETCSFEKHFNNNDPKYTDMFKFDVSDYMCINNINNYNTFQDDETGDRTYFAIYLALCKNTTENNNHCYPSEYIVDKLKTMNMYFEFYVPEYMIDHYNFYQPLKEYFFMNRITVSYDLFYSYFHYYKSIVYSSDDGSIFEDINTHKGQAMENVLNELQAPGTKKFISNSLCGILITVTTDYADVYKRHYPKLQSVLANIGGVFKLILFMGKFISNFITTKMMFVEVSNEIIHYGDKIKLEKSLNVTTSDKNNISNTILVNNLVGDKKNSEYKKISIIESIIPSRFTKLNSAKRIAAQCEDIIKSKMSYEYILNFFESQERLMNVILDDDQLHFFKNLRNKTLDEHINKMKLMNTNDNELKPIIENDLTKSDKVIKRILTLYNS